MAPQWVGRPPRPPLTPARAFVEARRAVLLAQQPDLKLLPCAGFSLLFPSDDGNHHFVKLYFTSWDMSTLLLPIAPRKTFCL